ncbi:MAG: hypothetical protein ABSD74_02370 [Rhizomicrobium sp.]|jgi:hypothetical protein
MNRPRDVSYFFGGAFLANAVPHFVGGMMGRPWRNRRPQSYLPSLEFPARTP